MTNAELVTLLEKNEVPADVIEKVNDKIDMEKIESIINAAHNPREVAEKLKLAYPEIEVDDFLKQMDIVQEQMELAAKGEKKDVPIQLSTEELDKVVGGGWWGDNWKKLAIAVGVGIVVGSLVGAGACIVGGPYLGVGVTIVAGIIGGVLAFHAQEMLEEQHKNDH